MLFILFFEQDENLLHDFQTTVKIFHFGHTFHGFKNTLIENTFLQNLFVEILKVFVEVFSEQFIDQQIGAWMKSWINVCLSSDKCVDGTKHFLVGQNIYGQ